MSFKYWLMYGLACLTFWTGCARKPPAPPPAMESPVPTLAKTQPPMVDTTAMHRQRLQARIAETFKTIHFDYDKSELTPDGKVTCNAIGELMQKEPGITVRIEGNTDERGTDEYNLALGDQRAKAAQAYLRSYGIVSSRVSTISFGKEKPVGEGHDEAAWSRNRRDDFSPAL